VNVDLPDFRASKSDQTSKFGKPGHFENEIAVSIGSREKQAQIFYLFGAYVM